MRIRSTPFEALKLAVENVGSQSAFARLCGVSQTAVWKWLQSGKRLPAEHVLPVEAATGVSRHVLRPDIYPVDPRASLPGDEDLAEGAPIVRCDRGATLQRDAA